MGKGERKTSMEKGSEKIKLEDLVRKNRKKRNNMIEAGKRKNL